MGIQGHVWTLSSAPSSSGLGRRPLKAVAPVRIRSGLPHPCLLIFDQLPGVSLSARGGDPPNPPRARTASAPGWLVPRCASINFPVFRCLLGGGDPPNPPRARTASAPGWLVPRCASINFPVFRCLLGGATPRTPRVRGLRPRRGGWLLPVVLRSTSRCFVVCSGGRPPNPPRARTASAPGWLVPRCASINFARRGQAALGGW